jgi:hypothetical protein
MREPSASTGAQGGDGGGADGTQFFVGRSQRTATLCKVRTQHHPAAVLIHRDQVPQRVWQTHHLEITFSETPQSFARD